VVLQVARLRETFESVCRGLEELKKVFVGEGNGVIALENRLMMEDGVDPPADPSGSALRLEAGFKVKVCRVAFLWSFFSFVFLLFAFAFSLGFCLGSLGFCLGVEVSMC
jgi:hypothetical protein